MPDSFIKDCKSLGLFKTRMPRFRQLFFYNFHRHEFVLNMGQGICSTSSARAAKAYLRSGVQLGSKCGLSDVWYHYVETYRHLFEDPEEGSPLVPDFDHPHPRLHPDDAPAIYHLFEWLEKHSRPRPTKKRPVPTPLVSASRGQTYKDELYQQIGCSEEVHSRADSQSVHESADRFDTSSDDELAIEMQESPTASEYGIYGFTVKDEHVDEQSDDGMDTHDNDALDEVEEGRVKTEDCDPHLELWSASFENAVVQSMGVIENTATHPPMPVTNTFVLSSIPEERELDIGEAPMEGVELSQPTGGHVTDPSDDDNEEVMEDEGYTADSE